LNQNQFDALVSFVHNITPEAFANCLLLKMLNEGKLGAIPAELKKWVKGKIDNNAVIVPELVKRRDAEASLFASSTPAIAQSLSLSKYSRPFYDTGEHSLMGQFINSVMNAPIAGMDELSPTRLYSVNGVQFTYGQIITMGDFYDNYAQMNSANSSELQGLKNLIIRSENLYKNSIYKMGVGNAADPSQSEWNTVTGGRYLDLAAVNNSHFAPPPPESVFKSSKQPNNKSTWEFYHKEAINKVRGGSTDDDYDEALKINAFGDHFLTDAFSAGHLVNKELMIEHFKILVMSCGKVDADGTSLLDAIAKQSFKGAR